ncbi:uncharacterized protein EAE97_004777 [Botrytis byssoidea]|uniref:Uncharacterized protein n=1 Tax=Botrytis byssoidea TaxID=139641 RepID=A0A9P5LVI8_9HELO|nr:uncharacterized protein EAE97_004777 [Botrytis byssoidea]KAF7945739.1 hypothetical protein EAE97_004777 [Botrytis byssoidea]
MTERSNVEPDPYIVETAERESKVISLVNQVDEYVRWTLAEELRACQMVGGVRSTMLEIMVPLDMENPWFSEEDDESRRSARFTDFIENLESMAPQRYVQVITRGRVLLVHTLVTLNKDIKLWRFKLHSTASIRFRRESYRITLQTLRDACSSSLSSSRDKWEEIMEEVRSAESGGYPREPLIINELENYFDPDIFMTQRVRRESRITENKWLGIIAAKMKIMINEYKVRRQGVELFVAQIDELYACWYPKKGNNTSYNQANGDPWGSSRSGMRIPRQMEVIKGDQAQWMRTPRQEPDNINKHPQPSSSTTQTVTKHGKYAMTSSSTTHDTETSSKNTISKKRKQSTLISETSDASTESKPKRCSGKNVSTSTVDDPTTSLNARRTIFDKTQKRKPFDKKMKEIIAMSKEVYYLEH